MLKLLKLDIFHIPPYRLEIFTVNYLLEIYLPKKGDGGVYYFFIIFLKNTQKSRSNQSLIVITFDENCRHF